ncbi:unnamed protein product [Closterium sp. NIES-54]
MASHSLVSGLLRVFLSLPPSLAPPCTPCVAGRLHATPHSSLRPATAPFQTLHLDVWGPAPTIGPERERYFLVVVDDYSRYTTAFPLAKKSEVTSTLIRWLLGTKGTRGSRVRYLHSDRGGEFYSGVHAKFYGEQGIRQSWTLPESPQHNGVAERRICLVMDIARTSTIHARAPHFLWPYALRYATHQLNLQPHVSRPEVSPTRLWTGSPSVGSAFHVWGCLALVRNTSADKLSARAIPCVFLGFPMGSPDYSFYHPPLDKFLDSRDVRFDESVSYYTRYPCRGLPVPPPPLFLAPSPPPAPAPPVPPPPLGPAPLGVSHATPLSSVARQVTVDSVGVGAGGTATGGTRSGGACSRGVGARGAGAGGASSGGVGAGGHGTGGASCGGAGAGGAGAGGASFEGTGAGGAGAGGVSSGGAGAGGACAGGASSGGTRAGGPSAGGASSGGAGVGGAGCVGAGPEETGAGDTTTAAPPAPSHRYDTCLPALRRLEREEQERLEQERQELHRLLLLSRTTGPDVVLRALGPRLLLPTSTLSCFVLVLVVLPSPPESSLTISSHPITDYYHAARLVFFSVLATLVIDPRASSSSVSALPAAVADFASTSRLDYATCMVAAPPPRPLSVGGESALGCDVLMDRQFELEFLVAAYPSLCAMLLSLEGDPDALDIPTPRTYRAFVDAVPLPRANIVDGMWLFKVKRPPGSPPVFKARYVARGFIQREGVDFFETFAPTPKMTTLRVLLHVAAQRDYELHSLDFSTAFL